MRDRTSSLRKILFFIGNREDIFYGFLEKFGNLECQEYGGRIIPFFNRNHRLTTDAEGIRKRLLSNVGLGSERRDTIVCHFWHGGIKPRKARVKQALHEGIAHIC